MEGIMKYTEKRQKRERKKQSLNKQKIQVMKDRIIC
jgi:hypothetical protein